MTFDRKIDGVDVHLVARTYDEQEHTALFWEGWFDCDYSFRQADGTDIHIEHDEFLGIRDIPYLVQDFTALLDGELTEPDVTSVLEQVFHFVLYPATKDAFEDIHVLWKVNHWDQEIHGWRHNCVRMIMDRADIEALRDFFASLKED